MLNYDAYRIKKRIQNEFCLFDNYIPYYGGDPTIYKYNLKRIKNILENLKQTQFLNELSLDIDNDAIELFEQLDIFYNNKDKEDLLSHIEAALKNFGYNPPSMGTM